MIVSPGMVAGRYRVESLIGVGGTSTVWSVRHTLLGSRYALKILRRKRASSRKRILQEGRVQ
ncbi:MAG: serine/threonine protein kinase, partial [Myxococcota bacterium]